MCDILESFYSLLILSHELSQTTSKVVPVIVDIRKNNKSFVKLEKEVAEKLNGQSVVDNNSNLLIIL